MKVVTVVGARPQLIKAIAVSRQIEPPNEEVLVHTGQHYDEDMSKIFFEEFGIPAPAHNLGIGSGSHGQQTGAMLEAIEQVLEGERPDAVLVYGDANSTLAGALAAAKMNIPIAHIEAGLRSFNRSMPEEVNRVVVDHLSRWLFAPSNGCRDRLAEEGITHDVYVVGDVMLDALKLHMDFARRSTVLGRLNLVTRRYYVATVHRAANTDDPATLSEVIGGLSGLDLPVVLPLHPRTRKMLAASGIAPDASIRVIAPLGRADMLALEIGAACILTDSGGLQKEAYWLRVPCVTLRNETEWIETVDAGWNRLVGTDAAAIRAAVQESRAAPRAHPDLYGDGMASRRIVETLVSAISM